MTLGSGRPSLNVAGSADDGRGERLDFVEADVRGRSMLGRKRTAMRAATTMAGNERVIVN
jgi:hypothetical protein